MKFYDLNARLFAVNGDKGAVWQTDAKQWAEVPLAGVRKAQVDGLPIDEAEAKSRFPKVDFDATPELV